MAQPSARPVAMPSPSTRPRPRRSRLSGRVAAGIALILGLAATLSLARWTGEREQAHLQTVFRLAAAERVGAIRRELEVVLECVRSLQTFYTSSETVERAEFATFASAIIERHRSIPALLWLPRVTESDRPLFETDAQTDGFPAFAMFEFGPDGERLPAAARPEHFPVWYAQPADVLADQMGFDFAANSERTSAMWRAIDTNSLAMSVPVTLPTARKAQRGVLLFSPVFFPPDPAALDRPPTLRGVVLGMICVSELATDAVRVFTGVPLEVRIADTAGVPEGVSPGLSGQEPDQTAGNAGSSPLVHSESIRIHGRRWLVTITAPPGEDLHIHSAAPLITLIAGSLLSVFLSGFVWAFMGRARARELALDRADAAAAARRTLEQAQAVGRIGSWVSEDPSAGRLEWSDEVFRIFGLDPGRFDGRVETFFAMVHPEDRAAVQGAAKAAMEDGAEYSIDHRIIRPDGSVRWVHEQAEVERDEQGAVRMIGVVQDISARRQAEEAVRAGEERYRAFISQSSEAIWRFELSTPIPVDTPEDEFLRMVAERARLAECNEVMARMYGAEAPEQLIGRPLGDLLVLSDPHNVEFLRAFRASGFRLTDVETHEVDLDGNAKYFVNNLVGIVSHGMVTRVWGTQRDITDRRAAERLRAGQNRVLELLAAGAALTEVLTELIRVVEEQDAAALGSVLLLDDDGVHIRTAAAPRLPQAYSRAIDGTSIGPSVGSCGTAMHQRRRVIVEDIATDPLWANFRDMALGHGLRACWSEPIVGSGGRVLGSFAMYYRTPRSPGAHEVAIITSAAHLAGVAIERRADEEKLRTSEANLRALLSAIPDIMFRMDRQGRYLDCHAPNAADLYAPREQFLGRTVRDVFPAEHAERCMIHVERAIATGIPQTYEYQIDGAGKRCWEVRVARCADNEALLLVRNVTERRLAERRLQDSEQRLSLLVQQSPVGVIVWNTDFTITEWNAAAEHIFGWTAGEAIGRTADLIVPERVRPHVQKVWEALLSRRGGTRSTNQNSTKDGRTIFCDWYNAALAGPDGRVFAIASIVDDVTEQRTAQRRQELLMAELDHRVKNNLAAVLSLAEHTGRSTPTFAEFRRSFSSRVRAMARTHGLLARSSWKGAELGALVRQTLEAFHDPQPRVTIEGPELNLPPRAAQSLAMALNELATNAAKYGALSTAAGHVDIRWRRSDAQDPPLEDLVLTWVERGGPALPQQPARRGFGTELIEGAVRYELQGTVIMSLPPDGLECSIRLPQDALLPDQVPAPRIRARSDAANDDDDPFGPI